MKQLFILLLLLCSGSVFAQDVIVKKDGSTILSKVLEVNQDNIKYRRFDNQSGPTYTINKSEVQAINYQNGMKEKFSDLLPEDNNFQPNNQNDGARQMNDNALLQIDYVEQHPNSLKKVKPLKTIGWVAGVAFVGIGTPFLIKGLTSDKGSSHDFWTYGGIGIGCYVAGALCAYGCLSKAKQYERISQQLQSMTLFQKRIKLNNGDILLPSIDLLQNLTNNKRAIGLGVCYNF